MLVRSRPRLTFLTYLLVRRDGTFVGKGYEEVSVCRVRQKPTADGEEAAPRRPEKRRLVLQHWRFAPHRPGQLCLLPRPSWRHFQVSFVGFCGFLTSALMSVVVSVAGGKARTLPRQRLRTFSRWLAVFWKQTSTGSKWKVKHRSWSQKPAALLPSAVPLTHVSHSGHEGRIGMAAVVLKEGEEFDCLDAYKQVVNYLPSYARPRFIRIQVGKDKVALHASQLSSSK